MSYLYPVDHKTVWDAWKNSDERAEEIAKEYGPALSSEEAAAALAGGHPKSDPVPIHPGASGRSDNQK